MIKSACFVGARWSWHRDFPCLVAKTGVYHWPGPKQRGLTPFNPTTLGARYELSPRVMLCGAASAMFINPQMTTVGGDVSLSVGF
jgi:hypothetical protein